jgi:hypothetical protein
VTLIGLFLVGAWFCLLWYQVVHYLPEQRAIVGCRHTHGRLVPSVPTTGGRMTALVWRCKDCPLQIPLDVHRLGVDKIEGTDKLTIWLHREGTK